MILDYAHTPDALRTCIENVREHFSLRKVNILFSVEEKEIKKREHTVKLLIICVIISILQMIILKMKIKKIK